MDLNKPLPMQVYHYIKNKILNDELDKDTFYSETKMAKELSISRTPLRDALRYLEQDGYIVIVPSRGFRIRKLDQEGLRASIEIRCAIEGYCTFRAAERSDTPQARDLLEELEHILAKMEQCVGDPALLSDFIDSDHAFHSRIISFSGIKEFHTDFQKIYYLIRQTSESALKTPGRVEGTLEEHRRILRCIQAGDVVSAYQEMIEHLRKPLQIVEK